MKMFHLLGLTEKTERKIVPCDKHLLDYISYLIMASVSKPYNKAAPELSILLPLNS